MSNVSLKVPDVNDTIVVIEYNFGFVVHAEKAGMETGGGVTQLVRLVQKRVLGYN